VKSIGLHNKAKKLWLWPYLDDWPSAALSDLHLWHINQHLTSSSVDDEITRLLAAYTESHTSYAASCRERSTVHVCDVRVEMLVFNGALPQMFTRGERRTLETTGVLLLDKSQPHSITHQRASKTGTAAWLAGLMELVGDAQFISDNNTSCKTLELQSISTTYTQQSAAGQEWEWSE